MPRKKKVRYNEARIALMDTTRYVQALWKLMAQDKLGSICPYNFCFAMKGPDNYSIKEPLELTYYKWKSNNSKLWVDLTDDEKALDESFTKIVDEIIKGYKYNGYYLSAKGEEF